MRVNYFNNIGVGAISLGFVFNHVESLNIAKSYLVLPLLFHSKLLDYFSRKNTNIQSIEKIIADKTFAFSNFNKRFYDSIVLTTNSIQYLIDLEYIMLHENLLIPLKPFPFDKRMGKRADRLYRAASRVAKLLRDEIPSLYLNLRIEL